MPLAFKAEALRLCRESGQALQHVVDDLGVRTDTLHQWVKRRDITEGFKPGLASGELAELDRLRRVLKILREGREILKQAAVFFAEEAESLR